MRWTEFASLSANASVRKCRHPHATCIYLVASLYRTYNLILKAKHLNARQVQNTIIACFCYTIRMKYCELWEDLLSSKVKSMHKEILHSNQMFMFMQGICACISPSLTVYVTKGTQSLLIFVTFVTFKLLSNHCMTTHIISNLQCIMW